MDVRTAADILAMPTVEAADRCPTTSSAAWLGRQGPNCSTAEAIRQVTFWLRLWPELAEMWTGADEGHLQRVAYWLIQLRDVIEAKEAYERDVADDAVAGGVVRDWRPPAPFRADAAVSARPGGERRVPVNRLKRITPGVWVLSRVLGALTVWVVGRKPVRGFRAG